MRITAISLMLAVAGCAGPRQGPENLDRDTLRATSWARPPVSAGDLAPSAPDRGPAEIAALRAEGPPALARLLEAYDAMTGGANKAALGATIDKVAAQRYATVSRLYWYTDLEAAKRAARAAGKPILSLRLLGRLDEDLSCANSRLFRVVLYANRALSDYLRQRFVLHWSSERPVPRVVIDYGDGRKLERTITGNSIHYVLDAEGRPIDAIPGVYAPAVFRAQLEDALAIARALEAEKDRPLAGGAFAATRRPRSAVLADEHRKRLANRAAEWKRIGAVAVPIRYGDRLQTPAMAAMRTTVTKSGMEMPTLRRVSLGQKLGEVRDDPAVWAQLGLRLLPGAMPRPGEKTPWLGRYSAIDGTPPQANGNVIGSYGRRFRVPRVPMWKMEGRPFPVRVPAVLDESSRALIRALAPKDWSGFRRARKSAPPAADGDTLERLIARLERDVVADTAKNELAIRTVVREIFASQRARDLVTLNRLVYAEVFRTPANDAWLGLAPSSFLALPGDGLVTTNP